MGYELEQFEGLRELLKDVSKKTREELEKKILEFACITQAARDINSTLKLEECLKILADRIADLLSVERVSLMLLDPKTRELVIKMAKGLDDSIAKQTKIKLGEGVAGWIAEEGKPLLITDIDKDPRFTKKDGGYSTNSLLSVPLKVKDKVIGVINVNNKITKDVFKEDDLGVLMAISELAAIAIENARLHEELKTLDNMKSNFIANVSHELRSPLASIKESVSLLLDEVSGALNSEQRRFLEIARKNIDRLSRLIDDLLDLAKIESGRTEMKRLFINIIMLVEDVINSFKVLAESKNIILGIKAASPVIKIWADPDKLTQAISNLLDNAIKYSPNGSSVTVEISDKGSIVEISVIDNGIGISKENIERLFDKFSRLEDAIQDRVKGTGLGLVITKELVQMHGGEIFVDSKPGEGSRFYFTLPKDLRKRE
ncbi:MAG: GAF domain-containing protein [Candidatus Omnitrophica bacterium]|nr:GAF domain-containing protein [Candidatus Omnitrophota bacterium]